MTKWRPLNDDGAPRPKISGVIGQTGLVAYGLDENAYWFDDRIRSEAVTNGAVYVPGGRERFDAVVFGTPTITVDQVTETMARLWVEHQEG